MKNIFKKIRVITINLLMIGFSLSAEILVDDVDFDNLELRTLYVGSLSITTSVGRTKIASEDDFRAVTWSPDSRYVASTRTSNSSVGYLAVQDSKTLRVLAPLANFPSNQAGWIYSLSWSVTNTSGASYIAVPAADSVVSFNYVYIYKFNGNSLQFLPNATVILPQPGGLYISAQWSPNGQYLAAATGSTFSVYSFDGSRCYLLSTINYTGSSPAIIGAGMGWSPDGKYVGFIDWYATAQIYSFDGTTLTPFIATPFIQAVSQDNNYLHFHPTLKVFSITRYRLDGFIEVLLYSYTSAGGLALLQTLAIGSENASYGGSDFAWSPDGAYFSVGIRNIYFYSFNGTTATNIGGATISSWTTDRQSPMAWSPDGRYLALGQRTNASTPPTINGISNSSLQIFNTGLNPTPSLAETTAKAASTLTNIVTSTASQYWAIQNGDLKFSSTESVIARMRGRWEAATSQGSLTNSDHAYLLNNTVDGNFYAIDRTGKVHQSTSVIVGSKVRINWQVLPFTTGISPIFSYLIQGKYGLLGIDINKVVYVYRASSGWLSVGVSPL